MSISDQSIKSAKAADNTDAVAGEVINASDATDAIDATLPEKVVGSTDAPVVLPLAIEAPKGIVVVPAKLPNPTSGTANAKYPYNLVAKLETVLSQHGAPHLIMRDAANPYAIPINSKSFETILHEYAADRGEYLRKSEIREGVELLSSQVEMRGRKENIWLRVAPIQNGVEIDLGDDEHTRVQVTPDDVKIISHGSQNLFVRSSVSRPLVKPSAIGNLKLLKQYVNLDPVEYVLLTAWMGYTLALPKMDGSKYVILVIQGDQGSGKSSLCRNVILRLVDNHRLGVQILSGGEKELSIASSNVHLLCYDNVRNFNQNMADLLCVMATGGAVSSRALYTDSEMHIHQVHGPVILNGIHSFIQQPDLAQRCLPLRTLPISEKNRKFEAEMLSALESDLPAIFRGLLDLIAGAFKYLQDVEVTNPERMIDFVRWLAAMEKADGAPAGVYQSAYSDVLRQAQLDSLMEHPLASAVLAFASAQAKPVWTGSPSDLLEKLNLCAATGLNYSKSWPDSPIALSKRLKGLKSSLYSQGIEVDFDRGKFRTITIKVLDSTDSK